MFRAWSFQVTVNADLSQGASTQDKARLLKEHLRNRTAHSIKTSFISVSTFCDESQLSGQPDSSGLVSILIRGYVQTKQATPISTMQKFFADASWKPVPGGLAGDAEFRANRATLAKLYVFGEIGLNNTGREEQKRAKQVGCYVPAVPAESDNRIILFASSILWKSFCANLCGAGQSAKEIDAAQERARKRAARPALGNLTNLLAQQLFSLPQPSRPASDTSSGWTTGTSYAASISDSPVPPQLQ